MRPRYYVVLLIFRNRTVNVYRAPITAEQHTHTHTPKTVQVNQPAHNTHAFSICHLEYYIHYITLHIRRCYGEFNDILRDDFDDLMANNRDVFFGDL